MKKVKEEVKKEEEELGEEDYLKYVGVGKKLGVGQLCV